jgi:hypothetical protein
MNNNNNSNKQVPTIKEAIKKEYLKCSLDPVYFMKNYVKVMHQSKGLILFDLYPFQEKTLKDFHDYERNIILKSRQMGISTLVAAYSLWIMIFKPGKNILAVSIRQETSKEIVSKVQLAYKHLPAWLKVETLEENRLSLKLKNESRIIAATAADSSSRSFSCFLLIMDECIGPDTIISIRNKKTKKIKNIKIKDLFNLSKYS